jgi:hypothetical protein
MTKKKYVKFYVGGVSPGVWKFEMEAEEDIMTFWIPFVLQQ